MTSAVDKAISDLGWLLIATMKERDRARDIAVALEGQVAAVRALADEWHADEAAGIHYTPDQRVDEIRAALDPDPADRQEQP